MKCLEQLHLENNFLDGSMIEKLMDGIIKNPDIQQKMKVINLTSNRDALNTQKSVQQTVEAISRMPKFE